MKNILRAAAFLLAALGSTNLHAQLQTGTIHGQVVDGTGAVLPGVTVTLDSPSTAPRPTTTGRQGEFRFLNLPPGSYELRFALQGFAERTKSGIVVGVGQNVDLLVDLAIAGSAASVEVSGAAPVLEAKKTGTATNVKSIELQSIPSARDPWVVLQTVPGIMVDRVNVGGSESGQQSTFVSKGDDGSNTMWNIDGVTITDMGATGASPGYYDFDSFEEIQVTTGGSDPKLQTGGVGINLVTKRGGNELHASARGFFTDDSLQGSNVPAGLKSLTCPNSIDPDAPCFPGNRIRRIVEYGAELGGPILRDRVWFWGSAAKNDIRQLSLSGAPDDTQLSDYSGKLNAQLSGDNQATFFWYRGNKTKQGRGAGVDRPDETTWNQDGPTTVFKLEDFHTFGADLYLNGRVNHVPTSFRLSPRGGLETSAYQDDSAIWRGSYYDYATDRPQSQLTFDGNWFKAAGSSSHEFKFGFNYRRTPVDSAINWPGNGAVGLRADGVAAVTRRARPRTTQYDLGVYVGDTLSWGRATLNLGLRFDRQAGHNLPSSVPESAVLPDLLPAYSYAGSEQVFAWNNLSPRLGATFAASEDRKTLFRASYSSYADQLASASIALDNPFGSAVGGPGMSELDFFWADANLDGVVQRSEIDFATGVIGFYYVDPGNPLGPSPNRIDPQLSAPLTHEYIVGLEREVAPSFALGASFTLRNFTRKLWTPYLKADGNPVTIDDYEVVRTISEDDLTGATREWYDEHHGKSFSVPVYGLKDGVQLVNGGGRYLTNREGYRQRYLGFELNAARRLKDRWMMRASFSWGKWQEFFSDGDLGRFDPSSTQSEPNQNGGYVLFQSGGSGKGDVFLSGNWQFHLSGLYELPWGFTLGASVFGRQGYLAPLTFRVGDPDAARTGNLYKFMLIGSSDAERLDDVWTADLRLEKKFRIAGNHAVTLDADVFNLFNTATTLQVQRRSNLRVDSAQEDDPATINAFLRPREIVAPRLVRFGARYSF